MSQLIVKGHRRKQYKLNVTQFRSPMSAQINSAQTRSKLQHFPIRAGQPDINFTVKFANQNDHHAFNAFVRDHQINAQSDPDGMVTLWWPERNIENWTGYIVEYTVTERGFREPAPSVTFGVSLIASLMSERTKLASYGSSFWNVAGSEQRDTGSWDPEDMIRPPSPPSSDDSDNSSESNGPQAPPPVQG